MTEFEVHSVDPLPGRIVIVERREAGRTPDYRVHGETQCRSCGQWCWLGSETMKLVLAGVQALCLECSTGLLDEDNQIGHVEDER